MEVGNAVQSGWEELLVQGPLDSTNTWNGMLDKLLSECSMDITGECDWVSEWEREKESRVLLECSGVGVEEEWRKRCMSVTERQLSAIVCVFALRLLKPFL